MQREWLIDKIKARGLKLTPQRLEIVKVLAEKCKDHPSLNDLHKEIGKTMPTVSFSTVYNTLATLEQNGMIKLFDLNGETRVELNLGDHINVVDIQNGKIYDVGDEEVVGKILEEIDDDTIRDRKVLINLIVY